MNIIAVDDEALALAALRDAICEALPEESPLCFASAREALDYAAQGPVDVAFLDIRMDDMSGLALAERLCAICPLTNIIFVTGYSDYLNAAFELYASGYVRKPVLAKRILKEMSHLRHPVAAQVKTMGPYSINYTTQRVYFNGEDTLLKPREYQLFCLLAENPGVVFTAENLFRRFWGDDPVGSLDTVKMHISRLRGKLGMAQDGTPSIKAQRGKGYCLEWP